MMQSIQEGGEDVMAVDTAKPVVTWARRMWTADEYHRMAEVGILHEDDRVELIDGEIIAMSPLGSRHIACVNRLSKLFERRIGDTTIVQTQSSIRLNMLASRSPTSLCCAFVPTITPTRCPLHPMCCSSWKWPIHRSIMTNMSSCRATLTQVLPRYGL